MHLAAVRYEHVGRDTMGRMALVYGVVGVTGFGALIVTLLLELNPEIAESTRLVASTAWFVIGALSLAAARALATRSSRHARDRSRDAR
jgi:hypothetical protein